jgi:hypothetical protein
MNLGDGFSVTSDYNLDSFNDGDTYTTTGYDDELDIPDFLDELDSDGGVAAVFAFVFAFLGIFLGTILVLYIYNGIVTMKIFGKANHKNPWAGWVPYYNIYVLSEVSGYPGYMGLISAFAPMVPLVGAIASLVIRILILHKLSLSFGHDAGFTVGLVLLNPIFMGILAFGKSEYVGPGGDSKVKPEWAN